MATASIRKDFVVADDDTCARLIKAMDSPVDLDQFIDKKTIENTRMIKSLIRTVCWSL